MFNWLNGSVVTMDIAAGDKSHGSEKLMLKVKKVNRKASPRLCCWICVFSVLFIILACPGLDPLEGKYETLKYAASFERDDFDICRGRRVYMYTFPPELNVVVLEEAKCNRSLIRWMDLCPRFSNEGYGAKLLNESSQGVNAVDDDGFDQTNWHDTDSYMLEMIFHTRLKKYRCLTNDSSMADAFFVPYYTGLLALDLLYEPTDAAITLPKRSLYGMDLIDWLEKNGGEPWRRFGGRDHFLIMGRTSWDFVVHDNWGTGFSDRPFISNMTSLLIERRTTLPHEQAIPYPTSFHPDSHQRLLSWIEKVENSEREFLFSYVGAPRPDSWSVRGLIGSSCINAGHSVCNLVNCSIVKCSHDPVSIYKSFLRSNFCLQPKGDTATRRSTFDCLISGAIPVFFDQDTAYTQYSWHLPSNPKSYSVYIPEEDLKKGVSIEEVLKSYSPKQIREMRRTVISVIPSLIYNGYDNDPSSISKDAFELSLGKVLEKISAIRKEMAPSYRCWMPFRPRNCLVE